MEVISGGGGVTERLSSQNLRDLLGIKEECHHNSLQQSTSHGGSLTLEAVLRDKRPQPPQPQAVAAAAEPLPRVESNRTLLDIIREDQTPNIAAGRTDGRRSWRHLKNKIRLRRRGGGGAPFRHPARFSSTTNSAEPTQPHIPNDPETGSDSGRRIAAAEVQERGGEPPPVRMSLMSLLAENDRQMGLEGSAYIMDEETQEGEEENGGTTVRGGGAAAYNSCCVCMVRHKGAAFIPCGHTFCRLCSRELWVQRGNCPLCNNYILEILDIF